MIVKECFSIVIEGFHSGFLLLVSTVHVFAVFVRFWTIFDNVGFTEKA